MVATVVRQLDGTKGFHLKPPQAEHVGDVVQPLTLGSGIAEEERECG